MLLCLFPINVNITSYYLLFVLMTAKDRVVHKRRLLLLSSLKRNQPNLASVLYVYLSVPWPNLKNLSGGLNLSRGLNMVGST